MKGRAIGVESTPIEYRGVTARVVIRNADDEGHEDHVFVELHVDAEMPGGRDALPYSGIYKVSPTGAIERGDH